MEKEIPEIIVTKGKKTSIGPFFKHSVGGFEVKQKTIVELSIEDDYFIIHFNCQDNPFVKNNYYLENNSQLWKQEVFEVFIAYGENDPTNYLEVEINPNNAIFVAKIQNPDKLGSSLHSDLINPVESGIVHNVTKEAVSWNGFLKLPLSLINYQDTENTNQYRVNFFRVILQEKQYLKDWECTVKNSIFACWNSTMANEPEFHRSKYFGLMTIIE